MSFPFVIVICFLKIAHLIYSKDNIDPSGGGRIFDSLSKVKNGFELKFSVTGT